MSTRPAVVQGIGQDRADLTLGDARHLGEFPVTDVAEGIPLEQADDARHDHGVDGEAGLRLRRAEEPDPPAAGLVAVPLELGGEGLPDRAAETDRVDLGRCGLLQEPLIAVLVAREEPLVAEEQHDAGGMELPADPEGDLCVPRPAAEVGNHKDVEGASGRGLGKLEQCGSLR